MFSQPHGSSPLQPADGAAAGSPTAGAPGVAHAALQAAPGPAPGNPIPPLWQRSAEALNQAYAEGSLSPVEVLQAVIAQRDRVNPVLNALVAWDDEACLAAARASELRWQRQQPLSPMDGIPLTVKDNIPVQGLPCRWGSRLYQHHRPAQDELPVQRLRAGGALLLGKTNVPEFTLLGYTSNLLAGTTGNPWDSRLTPGGSSGGAVAAVAAGIGPLALATDGGGSIRRPCSHTGLVGLKPSWGFVPRADGLPEMLPEMEVIGPIARSMADLQRLLALIAPGHVPLTTRPARQHIVYWRQVGDGPVDPQVLQQTDAAAQAWRSLGHEVHEQAAPELVDRFNREAWPVISATGLAAVLAPLAAQHGFAAVERQLSRPMAALWANGRGLPATALFQAQQLVRALRAEVAGLLGQGVLLVTPTAAALPWPAEDSHPSHIDGREAGPRGHAVFTAFANACGLPALALPVAPVGGLPVGMQLLGPVGSDALLCALGRQWEQARPWATRWPAMALAASAPLRPSPLSRFSPPSPPSPNSLLSETAR